MHNNNNPKNQYRTIFAAQPQQQQPNANHPLFYYQHRNDFLSSLSDRYSAKYNLPTMDLKRNVRVGYYMDRYEDVRRRVEKEERKERCYLDGEFQTVFSGVIGERRERNRERREEEQLRRDLQRFYLQEQQNHEEPEQDHPNPNIPSNTNQNKPKTPTKSSPQYKTILTDYRTDPQKQKQLYLLDLQIGKLQLQQKLQKKVKQNRETCRNQQLISKLSNNILSAYMVNFDEIYNQLIDEILVEEVYYLNYMEAQYHVEKDQWNGGVDENLERFQNAKTIKMMEVVKGLEDLCDD